MWAGSRNIATVGVRPTLPINDHGPVAKGPRPAACRDRTAALSSGPGTVRLVEIAEILGVTHQRTSVIVRKPGFPEPVGREGQSRLWARGHSMGEAVAAGEALALTARLRWKRPIKRSQE